MVVVDVKNRGGEQSLVCEEEEVWCDIFFYVGEELGN